MVAAGRWVQAACLALALAAGAVAVQRAATAWRAMADNRLMADGQTRDGAPPRVLLAHAIALERAGRFEQALDVYVEVEALGSPALCRAARVNVANLYLRRGIQTALEGGEAQRAMVLLQLAKSGLRSALRDDPDDWDARYNLELALRLLPDIEARSWRRSGHETEVEEALRKDKAAWTEMVGTPRGLH